MTGPQTSKWLRIAISVFMGGVASTVVTLIFAAIIGGNTGVNWWQTLLIFGAGIVAGIVTWHHSDIAIVFRDDQ